MQPLRGLTKLMRECWFDVADARLSSLRIKKSLAGLREAGARDGGQDKPGEEDSGIGSG